MFNYQNNKVMKKIMILAISAIVAVNLSAQEKKVEKAECRKDKKECKFTPEQRIEQDIQILSDELYLSEEQSKKFADTYREFMAAKAKLNKEFAKKFSKNLNDRQVQAVLHFRDAKCCKGDFHGKKGEFHGKKSHARGMRIQEPQAQE